MTGTKRPLAAGMCVLCAVCSLLAALALPARAAEGDAALYEARVASLENERAAAKLQDDYEAGRADIDGYTSGMARLLLENARLRDEISAMEDAREPRRTALAGVWADRMEDARARLERNAARQAALRADSPAARVLNLDLLPLARERKAISRQMDSIRWQAANRTPAPYTDLEDELWEARYLSFENTRDREAAAYAYAQGTLGKQAYEALRDRLEEQAAQHAARVGKAENALAERRAQAGGVLRESDYNDYFAIKLRLERIPEELERLERDYESGSITIHAYKHGKSALEKEQKELRRQRDAFGYRD